MFSRVKISNPKITRYPSNNLKYYAGYNPDFVTDVLKSTDISSESIILDPWNGVGTTTTISNHNGFNSIGVDINLVMIICARASLLSISDVSSISSLASEIISKLKNCEYTFEEQEGDPLLTWIDQKSLLTIRQLNTIINQLLVSESANSKLDKYDDLSTYASFFYLAIFKTLRILCKKFNSSNPTWVKKPKDLRKRIRPSKSAVIKTFKLIIESLVSYHESERNIVYPNRTILKTGDSASTDLKHKSIDLIITSPPYCTRIDYAISTQIELAFLYIGPDEVKFLRSKMIGTSTINKVDFSSKNGFGRKTNLFLNKLKNHTSKASSSYYYKSHFQYYNSMYNSMRHLTNDILKEGGGMVLVVQDSYYKDIHNDLQSNLSEIAESLGMSHVIRKDFETKKSLATINPGTKSYRKNIRPIESVICFQKN